MTHLSDKDHKAQMAAMKAFDEQMPCVGIFWYDPEVHTLCDVHKKELTPGMIEAAAKNDIHYIEYSTSSLLHQPSDIKRSACGRVAWNIDKFIVLVGHWANRFWMNSRNCLSRSSPCRILSLCTTPTGTSAKPGPATCPKHLPSALLHHTLFTHHA